MTFHANEMAERLEIHPDLCICAYGFRESGFTSSIIVFVDGEHFEFSK